MPQKYCPHGMRGILKGCFAWVFCMLHCLGILHTFSPQPLRPEKPCITGGKFKRVQKNYCTPERTLLL